MMTPEERARFIEEEKAHLRKLRALKAKARQVRTASQIRSKLTDMVSGMADALRTHDEMVDQLDRDSARSQARYELATEQLHHGPTRAQRADAVLEEFRAEVQEPQPENNAPPTAQRPRKTIGRTTED